MQENHLKNQFEMAPTVAVVLILSLLLTYFLMSGTMNSINDVSEQEALALLTENAVHRAAAEEHGSAPVCSADARFLPVMQRRPRDADSCIHSAHAFGSLQTINVTLSRAEHTISV